MNEHSFIRSIHKLLPKEVYKWKINDPYQGGVADAYYSGPAGDLWVEYKFIKSLPKRTTTVIHFTKHLSPLQQTWLKDRHKEGRAVAVVVGSDKGHVILPGDTFLNPLNVGDFIRTALDRYRVSSYIQDTTINLTPNESEENEPIQDDKRMYG